jgi:hypothetical protein
MREGMAHNRVSHRYSVGLVSGVCLQDYMRNLGSLQDLAALIGATTRFDCAETA